MPPDAGVAAMYPTSVDTMALDRLAIERMAQRIGAAAEELREKLRSQTVPDPELAATVSRLEGYARALLANGGV